MESPADRSSLRDEEGYKETIVYRRSGTLQDSLNQKIPYCPEDAPEVTPGQEISDVIVSSAPQDVERSENTLYVPPEQEKTKNTICGLRRKVLWTLVGLGIILVIIAIVVPVVVTRKSSSDTNAEAAAPTSTSASGATDTDTDTNASTNTSVFNNQLSENAGFAAVSFGTSMKSFYQNEDGDIFYETKTGDKVVDGPAAVPELSGAKVGTPMASVSWDNGEQIRIYYLNDLNELQEHSYNNGSWAQGGLSALGVKALATSQLAAIVFGTSGIRLYFQVTGLVIQEYTWMDGTWAISQSLPAGISGTGLAAVYYPPRDIRVYYQTSEDDLVIHEMTYGWPTVGEWGESPFASSVKANALKGSRIAATSWGVSDFDMRVFYHPVGSPGSINMCSWLNTTWEGPKTLLTNSSWVYNCAMSAMSPAVNQFRLVYQDKTNSSTDLWIVQ